MRVMQKTARFIPVAILVMALGALFPGLAMANTDVADESALAAAELDEGLTVQDDNMFLSSGSVVVSDGVYTVYRWTGSAVEPNVTVKDSNGKVLEKGKDYTLKYRDSNDYKASFVTSVSEEGCYRVAAEGMGDYVGTCQGGAYNIFCIAKPEHDITRATVTMPSAYSYNNGESMENVIDPEVRIDDVLLVRDTDYRLFYSKGGWAGSGDVGTHTFWLIGRGDDGVGSYYGVQYIDYTVVDGEVPVENSGYMHRLYNPNSGEHFYTANYNEFQYLVGQGWANEGEGWKAPSEGAPVYRLYNENAGDHHYTLDENEKNFLVSQGWNDEGIGWHSAGEDGVPLYRQYNPNATTGSHNYTTSKDENDYLVSIGWQEEGIGWYGI